LLLCTSIFSIFGNSTAFTLKDNPFFKAVQDSFFLGIAVGLARTEGNDALPNNFI